MEYFEREFLKGQRDELRLRREMERRADLRVRRDEGSLLVHRAFLAHQ